MKINGVAWQVALLVGSIGLIGATTLSPFRFVAEPGGGWSQCLAQFRLVPSSLHDIPRNIILFVPFGVSVAALQAGRGRRGAGAGTVVLLAGLLLSLAVEGLQTRLPGRIPNLSDLQRFISAGVLVHQLLNTFFNFICG